MKRIHGPVLPSCILLSLLLNLFPEVHGQQESGIDRQLIDMKLELLNSQIELFNSQLKVWEAKPEELEKKLSEIDYRIERLEFDPSYFNDKLREIEMLIMDYNSTEEKGMNRFLRPFRPDTLVPGIYKSAVSLNPVRLVEGTFHISYEYAITPKLGLGISGLATYATEEGISGYYMKRQSLDYFNEALQSSIPYSNKNIAGFGVELTLKNYLLTDLYKRQRSPVGLYASPDLLFRRLWLSGISTYILEDEWIEEEVTRLLNIFALGGNLGLKFTLVRVLYIDIYAGGLIRLAKYDDEERYTRYKSLGNIDFSGVMPTAGISIGILK